MNAWIYKIFTGKFHVQDQQDSQAVIHSNFASVK